MVELASYPKRYCPVCDSVVRRRFRHGPLRRPNARCPECRSLERQRFLAILLDFLRPGLGPVDVLLDIAPTPQTTQALGVLEARRHVRLDLGLDERLVDVQGDVTRIPLPDDSVDVAVCYHVLEHVPDDRAAMREIARVLRPGGLGLVQVPIRWEQPATDEDPAAPAAERVERFGQEDHVRFYGADFESRLVESGLRFQRVFPVDLLGRAVCEFLRLVPHEPVWIVRSGPGECSVGLTPGHLSALTEAMMGRMVAHAAERDRLRSRVTRLRRELHASRSRPVRRALARLLARPLARPSARPRPLVLPRRPAPRRWTGAAA